MKFVFLLLFNHYQVSYYQEAISVDAFAGFDMHIEGLSADYQNIYIEGRRAVHYPLFALF